MSLGIAVLDGLVRQAVASLGAGFEAEIHETHHRHKVDAPSGTALKLGASLAAARNQDFEAVKRYEPAGLERPLAPGEIGFEVRREGEIPGEHTVILYNEAERLELKHAVSSRRVFADGALRAAQWLSDRPPGLYAMRDLLFQAAT
jgi:4-hydroxy-tetrahydrodipicolinate reductase